MESEGDGEPRHYIKDLSQRAIECSYILYEIQNK
jgi:hypothetical protein